MNHERVEENTLAWKADAAFRQAAYKVIRRARQAGGSVVIWEDGRVKKVSPEEMELRLAAQGLPSREPVRSDVPATRG